VGWTKVEGWWKDTGKPEDIFEANRLILDDLAHEIRGEVKGGEIRGRVSIAEGTIVTEKSVIKGPALIGQNCLIAGNIVDSMIGRGAVIEKNKSLPKGSKFIHGDNSWVRI
jgi:glucose-1-phosphate thymidylyltransferase